MAIINQRTGYFGYTLDGTSGANPIDGNGRVRRCIFALTYPLYPNDVKVTITKGDDDWGAQMGDGSIIPLTSPVILFQNRDNCIVQFNMEEAYAANSPCFLVYRSDSAGFNVEELNTARPIVPNSVSGHFAMTTEGFDGGTYEHGNVDRLIATIPFPVQIGHPVFTISDDPSHWGARMGDGSIIPLRNPNILYTNNENAVIQFDMDEPYPSNSPCVLVYRSANASWNVDVDHSEDEFLPVMDILNIPTEVLTGRIINLSAVIFSPINCTQQGIVWEVISGDATINNNKLIANSGDSIVLQATVIDGSGKGQNFVKQFNITVVTNRVDVYADPQREVEATYGKITEKIFIQGYSDNGVIFYQWYHNTINNTTDATKIDGANSAEFYLPKDLAVGNHYFFCEVSSPGATSVKSRISHVRVELPLEGVAIYPNTPTLEIASERQLHYNPIPAERTPPEIVWESSDSYVIQVNETGMIKALKSGVATITVKTIDGVTKASLMITVPEFRSVTDVTGVITKALTETAYTLNPTIVPSNASHKDILWTVVATGDENEAISDISNGRFTAFNVGIAVIRLIIEHGVSPVQDFIRDFVIQVDKHYVGVDDITLTNKASDSSRMAAPMKMSRAVGNTAFGGNLYVGEKALLSATITPLEASYRDVKFELVSPGTTGAILKDGNEITVTSTGDLKVAAIVTRGNNDSEDFRKEFIMTALPGRVPVTSLQFVESEWDPHPVNGHDTELNVTVLPANASEKDVKIKLLDPGEAKVSFNEETNCISCDPSIMNYEMVDATALFELRVEDGIARGVDFVCNARIRIAPPVAPDIIEPVTDVEVRLPNPLRALYPILLNRYEVYPWNASQKSVEFSQVRNREYMGTNAIIYNPTEYDLVNSVISDFFDWNKDETYLFPWNPGTIELTSRIPLGDTVDHDDKYCQDTIDYIKREVLEFLPPYIPVKNIKNIPVRIPVMKEVILSPEIDTEGGTGFYNPFWDEEEASFQEIQWRIGSQYFDQTEHPNDANAVVRSGNILYARKAGKFTVQAYVQNGTAEPIDWYSTDSDGREQVGIAYSQLFEIEAVEEADFEQPIVTLKLQNSNTVRITNLGDFSKVCNNQDHDYMITIGSRSFQKDQIVEVEFGTIPEGVTLQNFGWNFTNLRKINDIPEGVTCLKNFLRGCTSFNQAITIPASVNGDYALQYFLRDCTNFNSAITFAGDTVEGTSCMHGFLYGCTKYNRAITLPENVSGMSCMERFMMKCTAFNQVFEIPSTVSGPYCLRDFMTECSTFNQDITLPEDVGKTMLELASMMRDCSAMCSTITVPAGTGLNASVNEQTLSCVYRESAMIRTGVTIAGAGAEDLIGKMENNLDNPAYRNVKAAE
ncbi:MAG: Ig-like domain-containing protein [Lachnospiraceae bacterium]|nr:Ig-like domain-containing protein [Lachnospiraceae bacterium]MCM1230750.1 Ig-like domain-containing protein [Ruminococcus flavefaciens]